MPEQEVTRDLIQRSYAAFNARDLDTALSALHPEVDWPNAIEGGRVRGHDEIRRYWLRQFEVSDPRAEPQSISAEADGRVVVDVRQVVWDPQGTLIADRCVQHIYTLRDGLIARWKSGSSVRANDGSPANDWRKNERQPRNRRRLRLRSD